MKTKYLFGLPFVTVDVNSKAIDAVVDTGFNGALMLPESIIQEMNLQKIGNAQYVLADGSSSETEVYAADVDWINGIKRVAVVSSRTDLCIVGMELLHNAKTTLYPARNILKIESGAN